MSNRLTSLTDPTKTANNPLITIPLLGATLFLDYDAAKRIGENAAILENGKNGTFVGIDGKKLELNDILRKTILSTIETIPSVKLLKPVDRAYRRLRYIRNSIKVPDKAYDVVNEATRTGYRGNLKGLRGGSEWKNKNNQLPYGNYKEFDVSPKIKGEGRNAERIVIETNTGKVYYTNDHYKTFKEIN